MFRIADDYRTMMRRLAHTLREPRRAFPWSERHLQCVWYDAALRPAALHTAAGEPVEVLRPGRWNLEPGPDFLDACLRVGAPARELRGDVEVHIRGDAWSAHGHARDPRYRRVIAHVTYFGGARDAALPAHVAHIALQEALARDPGFSFDAIDVTAYPYAVRALPSPLAEEIAGWSMDDVEALLDAAGAERVRRKANRLRLRIERAGREQALYEEVMAALGYKQNTAAFRRLALRLPLAELRQRAGGDAPAAYALLAGTAGLLPAAPSARWDEPTRRFVRDLWDRWWRGDASGDGGAMPGGQWDLARLRPLNHPLRRLAAAAALFADPAATPWPADGQPADNARAWLRATTAALRGLKAVPYWNRRVSLGGALRPRDVALIGAARAAAIISNVLIPALALRAPELVERDYLRRLPPEEDNALVRQAAFLLLGRDHNPALYRQGLRQQGLLQILFDFRSGA